MKMISAFNVLILIFLFSPISSNAKSRRKPSCVQLKRKLHSASDAASDSVGDSECDVAGDSECSIKSQCDIMFEKSKDIIDPAQLLLVDTINQQLEIGIEPIVQEEVSRTISEMQQLRALIKDLNIESILSDKKMEANQYVYFMFGLTFLIKLMASNEFKNSLEELLNKTGGRIIINSSEGEIYQHMNFDEQYAFALSLFKTRKEEIKKFFLAIVRDAAKNA